MTNHTTRLAPSPTGALHLGNARTFLITWAIARKNGWRLLMRMEDLDGPRIKHGAAQNVLDVLAWLGMDWDGDVLHQSMDLSPYRQAMRQFAARERIFACELTRAQIAHAASAPHMGEHELRFPPELRPPSVPRLSEPDVSVPRLSEPDVLVPRLSKPKNPLNIDAALANDRSFGREDTNYRLIVEDRDITIDDNVLGRSTHNPAREVGDFVIWTTRCAPAYQLAVVVDDARQGVTDVVRGDDLLPSAARQQLLYEALELSPPRWWHLPLVLGPDGRRLAKRHGDTRIESYREQGVRPQRIIGLLARWSGACELPCEMSAAEFQKFFDLSRLPRTSVTFTEQDNQWLRGE